MTLPLDPNQETASRIIKAQLTDWGVAELYDDAVKLIRQGLGTDAIILQLQDTNAYKVRFAANEDRRKAGFRVLSPAEYVDLETQYGSILRTFGLPAGFYDSRDDFRKFIAADKSPSEIQSRAQAAQQVWLSKDPNIKQAWTSYYGLTDGDAIAAILNPETALPIVQRKVTAAQIGGQALASGLQVGGSRAEQLADLGVTASDAAKGYGEIGQAIETDQAIATRFGANFTQAEEEDARLLGTASARRKLSQLQGSEAGLFAGRSSVTQQSLSRNSSGSY